MRGFYRNPRARVTSNHTLASNLGQRYLLRTDQWSDGAQGVQGLEIIPMRAPRRIYASWLPPNPRERAALVQLRRRQNLVIIWLIGILPAGWIATLVTRSGVLLVPLTIFWIVVGLTLAQRVATISCPRCRDDFCSKPEMPYWNALFTLRCESCGLTLNSERSADA